MAAGSQRSQGAPSRDRERICDDGSGGIDGSTIGWCISNDQQDMINARISNLEHDPANLGLGVGDPGLTFDWQPGLVRRCLEEAGDPGIPRTSITFTRQGYLEPHRETLMDMGA